MRRVAPICLRGSWELYFGIGAFRSSPRTLLSQNHYYHQKFALVRANMKELVLINTLQLWLI